MPNLQPIKVGLCGLGTVGQGVMRLLGRNQAEITRRLGRSIQISCLGMRSQKPHLNTAGMKIYKNIMDVAKDPDVEILVEAIGGEEDARTLTLEAISENKHVVTANKALIAIHGHELFSAAKRQGVSLCFEASVGGGIPIIRAIRESMIAGNRINALKGIINGTANYILTAMSEENKDFDQALAMAQQLGYAEQDPAFDVEGIDSAHKLSILAALAFEMPLSFGQVHIEGINQITPQDIQNASKLNLCVKHLAIARALETGYELRVHPTLIPKDDLLAHVAGVMNAVEIQQDMAGPLLLSGAGAGAEPTASAIIADLVDIALCTQNQTSQSVASQAFQPVESSQRQILPMAAIQSEHYVHLNIKDQPGALGRITQILNEQSISIKQLIQNDQRTKPDGTAEVSLIMLTHKTRRGVLDTALQAIGQLAETRSDIRCIRVETSQAPPNNQSESNLLSA